MNNFLNHPLYYITKIMFCFVYTMIGIFVVILDVITLYTLLVPPELYNFIINEKQVEHFAPIALPLTAVYIVVTIFILFVLQETIEHQNRRR